METKKIVMGVISIAVAIIVLMSMIPIFTDAGASEDTFTNEGYFRMAKYTSEDTFVASWDYENPNQITINGVVEQLPTSMNVLGTSIILGDNYYLRYVPRDSAVTLYYDGVGNMTASPETSTGMTIELGEESIVFQLTGGASTSRSVTTLTDFYAVNSTGSFVMKDAEKPAYLNGDTEIYGCGRTSLTGNVLGTLVTGSVNDGATVDIWRSNVDTTASNVSFNATEKNGHKDLYVFDSVTFNANYTYEETDYSVPLTYNFLVVPLEVTAERSAHASSVEATLIGLIPLLMMVGIMLTAVGLFIAKYRKN